MSIDLLALSCLQQGTSVSEQGKRAAIAKRANEVVLLFRTDCGNVRRILGIQRVCDATFMYMRHRGRPLLLFVELKGRNVSDAAEQISSTMQAIRNVIRDTVTPNFPQAADMRAIVVRSGNAPQGQGALQEKFFKATGVKLQFAREVADLRDYLT
jgi:hypothetical protein